MSRDDPANDLSTGLLAIQPAGWKAPRGYSNGMLAPAGGRLLFVAGQIAWDADQRIIDGGFVEQFARALANVVEVVRAALMEAGDEREEVDLPDAARHLASLTLFVVDKRAYEKALPAVGEHYRRIMGRHYPTMALVEVKSLLEPAALVEIQAQAVLP